ncbi:MAG TPA: tetratricopeptide repeat protein [Verrucomicrobiae bacterium]
MPSSPKQKPAQRTAALWLLVGVPVALALILGLTLANWSGHREEKARQARNTDAGFHATFGKSPSCRSCHEEAFENWENSHHALAERNIRTNLDDIAFDPPFKITHGTQNSFARYTNGQFQLVTLGPRSDERGYEVRPFPVARVLGVSPLRQYLVPFPSGRYQMTELAFDPRHPDWFNVYGEEDRLPGEWGHWTGRGMNWNSMCASCHNTGVRKHYDSATDSYNTTLVEHGVGCEACHGPMADHNAWQALHPNKTGDPTVRKVSPEAMMSVCGSCHARRGDLTGQFAPHESFDDHYWLTIVDDTDTFYPDGQIRDEDFEYTAFLGSRMHAAGTRCVNCHEPHAAKPRLTGNYVCILCHVSGVSNNIPQVDLATHSHHKANDRGDLCTGCHMPQTVYMQRHARHDHGFTIPDPLLTKQFDIPNACNRCHTERTADWSLEYVEKWYGAKMERPYRWRAQTVARARAGERGAVEGLLAMIGSDTNFYWRAVAANMLRPWIGEAKVQGALVSATRDTNAMVRVAALRALEPLARGEEVAVQNAFRKGLSDPVRGVRLVAAWALNETVATNSTAGRELLAYLNYNSDQPAGELQRGIFHLNRGDLPTAMSCFRRAVNWDGNSAPLRHALAVGLSMEGKPTEAVRELEVACRLAARDAEMRYKLGLAYGEANRPKDALAALKQATELDPQHSRAWYNLGLAYAAAGEDAASLECLTRAESLDNRSAQIPYARATVLVRLNRRAEARAAAARALELHPGHSEAAQLLQVLGR